MLNVVVLMGRLVADPELRQTPSGVSVTSFTLAVDRSYVKQGQERQTDFIDIVAWRKTAEHICKFFKKGSLIAVDGSIQTRKYTDRDGKNRTAFEVVANNVNFCESKKENNNNTYKKPKGQPDISADDTGDFEEISDNDLPFNHGFTASRRQKAA